MFHLNTGGSFLKSPGKAIRTAEKRAIGSSRTRIIGI